MVIIFYNLVYITRRFTLLATLHYSAEVSKLSGMNKLRESSSDDREVYTSMLWTSLAFATMGALSHAARERRDRQLVVPARSVFSALPRRLCSPACGGEGLHCVPFLCVCRPE